MVDYDKLKSSGIYLFQTQAEGQEDGELKVVINLGLFPGRT